MKRKTLLLMTVMTTFVTAPFAQKKQEPVTGFAITSMEKGGRIWKEVKLLNFSTGEVVRSVFDSKSETQPLNARTKKPVVKQQPLPAQTAVAEPAVMKTRRVVRLDEELQQKETRRRVYVVSTVGVTKEDHSLPFATNSAAMAYDKKHDRLYFTPMGINQLRFIDLKSGKVYYFENESFGAVKGFNDVKQQITRMVIAADGNGYALSNDARHLMKFTTGKKPVITDLGPVNDKSVPANEGLKIGMQMGGDMIADAKGNLYLVSAHRNVYKIDIDSRSAEYLGPIKGLPKGYSTNGAMVEGGSKVIVCSSESTQGYYRFDLETLESERIVESNSVFNASDLANGVLAFEKKKKDVPEEKADEKESLAVEVTRKPTQESVSGDGISVYPNPVTNGYVRISFANQPIGKYQVQVMDMSGKMVQSRSISLNGKNQIEELRIPVVAKGSYFVKIVNEAGQAVSTNKLVVQ